MKFRIGFLLAVLAVIWFGRESINRWTSDKYQVHMWKQTPSAKIDPCQLVPDYADMLSSYLETGLVKPNHVCDGLPLTFQAIKTNQLDALRTLYRHGADLGQKNDHGENAIAYAEEKGNPEIVAFLKDPVGYERAHPPATPRPEPQATGAYSYKVDQAKALAALDPQALEADLRSQIQKPAGGAAAIDDIGKLGSIADRASNAIPLLVELLGKPITYCGEEYRVCPDGTRSCPRDQMICPESAPLEESPFLSGYACGALQRFGEEGARALGNALFHHPHKADVINCLASFGAAGKIALPDLRSHKSDSDPLISSAALKAISAIQGYPETSNR